MSPCKHENMRTPNRRWRTAGLIALMLSLPVLALISGCGTKAPASTSRSASPTAYAVVSPATVLKGQPVPAPTGPVILTVTGKIRPTNSAKAVRFDMATLEKLGLVQYSVMDNLAEGREASFRGVLLDRLLATVGAHDVKTLHMVALNDYAVDIPISDANAYPVLIATSVDGKRMGIAKYGPVRIIYPTKTHKLNPTVYDPRWIWQLKSIEAR
jgi:hypothetical protein